MMTLHPIRSHDARVLREAAADLRDQARTIRPEGSSRLADRRHGLNWTAGQLERRAGQLRRGEVR